MTALNLFALFFDLLLDFVLVDRRNQCLHPLVSDQRNETDRGYSYELRNDVERQFGSNRWQGVDFQTPFLRYRNEIALRYKISGSSVEDRRAIERLDDGDMIGIDGIGGSPWL